MHQLLVGRSGKHSLTARRGAGARVELGASELVYFIVVVVSVALRCVAVRDVMYLLLRITEHG